MDMANVISILFILGLVLISAFYQLATLAWTILIGIGLVILTSFGWLSPLPLAFFWLVYLLAAAFSNLHQLRQQYIVKPALKLLQKQLPTISATERAAIEAGDTWWEKELFCGRPNWKKLFNIPRPVLSQEEQEFLNNQVEQLCSMLDDWNIVFNDRNLPDEVWNYLKQEKFFAMVIPREYGGLGFSALAHSTVVTKIATRSISAAVTTMVPNSLGPGELLVRYGTDEQKKYYLPRLSNGTDIPCFALTAPDAGSDAGAIPDTGIVCRGEFEGRDVLGMRVSWDKRYITLAPVATLLGLAIHLYDPDHLLGDKTDIGITLCLIPTSHPGVETGSRHLPMYHAFMNGPTRGNNVFIPLEWIIGGPQMAGQGWRMLMESLSIGRSISLPALSTACGKMAYRLTGAYSRIRRQFNTPIASFEGIEEALGYIAGYSYMLESCRMMTAGAVDQDINPSIVSAIAKYHMTEMCRHVVSYAMDVHAGQMIQTGPRNLLANAYLAVPVSITVEGANILTRNLIIFGQGAIRCHPYILKEIELISSPDAKVEELDRLLMSHIGFYVSNLLRNVAYGLTGGRFIISLAKNKRIKAYQRQLTRMSAALALLADTSLILLGGSLKRRERISARLGDIMSQLYLASAVLKYYYDHDKPASDVNYVCWSLQECLYKIQLACNELLHNFPNRWAGRLLEWIIFPFGTAYHKPRDRLHNSIVEPMLSASELRDRLTRFSYLGHDDTHLIRQLDQAIARISAIEPLQKKLQKAVQTGAIPRSFEFADRVAAAEQAGLLSADEARMLNDFEKLRTEIIKVNEFNFDFTEVIA
ncbi:Acyl-coenzyme A dehydrogenase [Aquicella siphonis]|uniref:Acyl-coenzyme A dehydrogenase n=1 Tax=Aquicella siphonis TaxID=254247 RepID=A0A5E4PHN3_9COXI|nr:acyl-CoA dehydrogenase [Aquicella siphonis]VVC75883.1 Acyl-coenzyme A dehydrogenase [Aquicella siphonis]